MSIVPARTPIDLLSGVSTPAEASRAAARDTEGRVDASTGAAPLRAGPLDLAGGTVLLATDGSEGAVAGAHVALALATRYHATVCVVRVVDTRAAPIPPPFGSAFALADQLAGSGVHTEQEQAVRTALSEAIEREIDWPVRIMLGTPAASVVQEARRVNASLIIVGLRRHGRLDRAMNDETSLNVMRHALCPVLGIVPGTTTLPGRVLCAIDFSDTSLIAARAARTVAGDDAALVLAYVAPLVALPADDSASVIHDLGVQAGMTQLAEEFGACRIATDHIVLHRKPTETPANALLDYAEVTKSDLVAAGSARHGRIDRWMLGSVSTDLVRNGRRSVLIVPPREPVRR